MNGDTITPGFVLAGVVGGLPSDAADLIAAGVGNDSVDGGGGADSLRGGIGNDVLAGGSGADTLLAGAGKDQLLGGIGGDRFVVTAPSDRPATAAGRDVIGDWGGADLIDLTGMDASAGLAGPQGFVFKGVTANTSAAKAGELWTFQFGGNTFVIGGVDGDNRRDFQIEISGLQVLSAGSFVL